MAAPPRRTRRGRRAGWAATISGSLGALLAVVGLVRAVQEARRRRRLQRTLNARRVVSDRLLQRLMDAGLAQELLHEAMSDLEHRATHDHLTGLPNRVCVFDRIEQAILAGHRSGSPTAVLLLDLNGFKEVNDSLGHLVGDRVLQCFGPRVTGVLRESDTLGRLGGDEFCVVLPEVTGPGEAATVCARITTALEDPLVVDGMPIRVGASCGIALAPDDGTTAEELLAAADASMYAAKRAADPESADVGTLDLRDSSPEQAPH
ncbi:MAG: diguanylate cyclase domain-containing protein [Acidimicrobiales bacterium]